ncbi:hypothetical protein F5Y06DRAFT_299129 [Hypoxylon sp. FL0890]|nr:hypothetical protein F5Y06DRAFT_299129 [Hypoxylon sp. FL0890]
MAADSAFHSDSTNFSKMPRWVVSEDTNLGPLSGLNNRVRQIRRDNPSQMNSGTIFAIVCSSIVFLLIVSLVLVYIHKRPRRQDDRAHELKRVEENVASRTSSGNTSRDSGKTLWREQVLFWQNKRRDTEAGTASGVVLSPRSKPSTNESQTSSGNKSVGGQRKVIPEDDGTDGGLFKVGSDDDSDDDHNGHVQTHIAVDTSTAKAAPIMNAKTSPKPVEASKAKGKSIKRPKSSSSLAKGSGRDAASSQNSASDNPVTNKKDK